jgi:hypothetical protein
MTMTKDEIKSNNILIAEFMGGVCSNYNDGSKGWIIPNLTRNGVDGDENNFKFHSSWDWLMPVIEKIENGIDLGYNVVIQNNECIIYRHKGSPYELNVLRFIESDKITSVYVAVVEFVKYFNETFTEQEKKQLLNIKSK